MFCDFCYCKKKSILTSTGFWIDLNPYRLAHNVEQNLFDLLKM